MKGYNYQVIVTNLGGWAPEEVWGFYNGQANVENMVKEGILGYGLDVTVSHYYGANVAHFFLTMLAYNLMNWFREGVLGQRKRKRMAKWIRAALLLLGWQAGEEGQGVGPEPAPRLALEGGISKGGRKAGRLSLSLVSPDVGADTYQRRGSCVFLCQKGG